MTIRNVLEADWTVDRMEVTVRDQSGKFITAYIIGKDVKPSKYCTYQYETNVGDVFDDRGNKHVFINRIIQHHQLDGRFKEVAKSFGVLTKEIPKELLNLEISSMYPYRLGRSDNLHGYRFVCLVDEWNGISGESELKNKEVLK